VEELTWTGCGLLRSIEWIEPDGEPSRELDGRSGEDIGEDGGDSGG
jgi:hypothetical protein